MDGAKIALILMWVSLSTALLFPRPPTVATAGGSVNQTCLALAEQGSCEFYTCFENRLRCGRNWYVARIGQYYCNKMERQKSEFTTQGQQFINDSQRCLTQSLREFYQRDQVNCSDLEHAAIASIPTCFVDNAFCDIFEANAGQFFQVYEFSDLFYTGADMVWRSIVSLAAQCGHEAIRELSSNAGETLIDTVNTFFESLSTRLGISRS